MTKSIAVPPDVVAVEEFLLSRTVPLFYGENPNKPRLLGTGTFFSILDRVFLVSASHVFDNGVKPDRVGVPDRPRGSSITSLGAGRLYRTGSDQYDVSVWELYDREVTDLLARKWVFLPVESLALPMRGRSYVVSGWPAATESASGKASLVTLFTESLGDAPYDAEKPIDPDLDVFLRYARRAERVGAGYEATLALEGMSGASVWEIQDDASDSLWSPESTMHVVAIQTSYRHSDFVRAKSWRAVAYLFGNIGDDIGAHVQRAVLC